EQAIETRGVEDAARARLLAHRRRADRGQPEAELRSPSRGVDDQVAAEQALRAVRRSHPYAADDRSAVAGQFRVEARRGDAIAEIDETSIEHVAAQDPLEGDAPAGERHDVLVAILERRIGKELVQALGEVQLLGA